MEILKANPNHVDDVYKLLCELENEVLDEKKFKKIYQANMKNNDVHYLLAVDNDCIFGFISLHIQQLLHHASAIAEIQELIITQRYQGAGAGTILFNKVKEIAIANDCLLLEVACSQFRTDSHKFYRKQGMNESHFKFTYPLE